MKKDQNCAICVNIGHAFQDATFGHVLLTPVLFFCEYIMMFSLFFCAMHFIYLFGRKCLKMFSCYVNTIKLIIVLLLLLYIVNIKLGPTDIKHLGCNIV